MKRSIVLLSMVAILSGCGGGGGGSSAGTGATDSGDNRAEWTYMVYMGADNNLSTAGLIDLNEMETVGSDSKVNIVLQAEFSAQYTPFGQQGLPPYNGQTLRFRVQKDSSPENVNLQAGTPIGNVDMASPAALSDFIRWAARTYPAKRYALVIWDHGAGWKASPLLKGAVQDATSDTFLSLPELARGVREGGIHFDLINFDACLMAMYEVAYEFRALADYLVFSEETEPGDGDPYDTILAALKISPTMDPRTLAQTIVDKYIAYYQNARQESVTKSAVATAGLEALHQAVLRLAEALVANYPAVAGAVASAQSNSQNFYVPSNYDLSDFCLSLTSQLPSGPVRSAAEEVKTRLADVSFVVANKYHGAGVSDARALAIYAPAANQISADAVVDELREYAKLASNRNPVAGWYAAVEAMVAGRAEDVVPGGFSFFIEWNTDADLDLYVWEPDELFAPWMGQSTPNGFFSGDSAVTGISEEYYTANDYVQPGPYDVIINYFEDGFFGRADVTFWYFDPQLSPHWQNGGTVRLNPEHPYLGDFSDLSDLDDLNTYSDWWYPGTISRAAAEARPLSINAGGRPITIRFEKKKVKPNLDRVGRES